MGNKEILRIECIHARWKLLPDYTIGTQQKILEHHVTHSVDEILAKLEVDEKLIGRIINCLL